MSKIIGKLPRVYAFYVYLFAACALFLTLPLLVALVEASDLGTAAVLGVFVLMWLAVLVVYVPRIFNASTIVLSEAGVAAMFIRRGGAWFVRDTLMWKSITNAEFVRDRFFLWDRLGRWHVIPMLFDKPQATADFILSKLPKGVGLKIS